MAVQQIIYNLENYNGAGLMSTTTDKNNVVSWDGTEEKRANYESNRIKIFEVNLVGTKPWSKMGVQGPPGTVFLAGSSNIEAQAKRIMIGRSGIFELGEDIPISYLKFEKPTIYKLDETTTKQKLDNGIINMNAADMKREAAMETLGPAPSLDDDPEVVKAYWDRYVVIQDTYKTEYDIGLKDYNLGISGVYVIDEDKSDEADIYNIIIDYID